MLTIPSFRTFPEYRVTAYRDSLQFWKMYLIPEYVSLRQDEQGHPVFQLIAYSFSDQDRERNHDLPVGGGYLTLEAQLHVDPAHQAKIVEQLQKDVDDTWHQLKAMADAAGADVRGYRISSTHQLPRIGSTVSLGVGDVLLGLGPDAPDAPPGDKPPTVILADPTWSDGTFTISAPQSANLVTNRVATGPLSLVGSNIACANLDLTAAGADFMVSTLTDPNGAGAGDLTPIQIVYSMHFWAQLPPTSVYATADSRNVFESVKSIAHDYEDGGCDEDTMSHSEQYLQLAVSSGLVSVRVAAEDPLVPADVVEQMRSDAVKTVQQMLTQRFFDKKPAPVPAADDPTKDFVKREGDVYYLKSESQVDFTHFEYREVLSTVRQWPVAPQGTLQAFLAGMTPDEVRKYVRKVHLDDPMFQTLGLHVAVFGVAWDSDPVDDVEVELLYTGTDENGHPVEKSTSQVFTKTSAELFWDPSLIGGKREYSYRWRIGYHGAGPSAWSDWATATTNRLTIAVSPPGKVSATFLAGNIDWANTTKSVQVEVSYADPGQAVPEDGTTLRLDSATTSQTYTRWIFVPQHRPLRYRTRFFLKNDQTIESPWIDTTADQVFVNEPAVENRLDVLLVPVGDWSHVVQSVVGLRYVDAGRNVHVEGSFVLRTAQEFKSWSVFLPDPTSPRTFERKVITTYQDGAFEESAWLPGVGDQPLALIVKQPPTLDVTVIPALVDFVVSPVVEVHLEYVDPMHDVRQTQTFALVGKDQQTWRVDLADPRRTDFSTTTTYHTSDGREIVQGPTVNTDDKVVVARLLAPEVACLMVPKLVDFTTTPVVEVDLHYVDPARGVDDTQSFTFTEPTEQHYRLPIAVGGPTSYDLAVTYYLANGVIAKRDPVRLSTSKIVVPRYVA